MVNNFINNQVILVGSLSHVKFQLLIYNTNIKYHSYINISTMVFLFYYNYSFLMNIF